VEHRAFISACHYGALPDASNPVHCVEDSGSRVDRGVEQLWSWTVRSTRLGVPRSAMICRGGLMQTAKQPHFGIQRPSPEGEGMRTFCPSLRSGG